MSISTEPFGQAAGVARGPMPIWAQAEAGIPIRENAKRRQIIEGARARVSGARLRCRQHGRDRPQGRRLEGHALRLFRQQGAAVRGDRRGEQCLAQAEQVFALDPGDHDVAAVLTRLGTAFRPVPVPSRRRSPRCAPSSPSPTACRSSVASSTRFRPGRGIDRARGLSQGAVDAGVLAVDDCEVAAAQFLEACHSTLFKPVLFGFGTRPRKSASSTWSASRCGRSSPPTRPASTGVEASPVLICCLGQRFGCLPAAPSGAVF